jgi:hypothetical protein
MRLLFVAGSYQNFVIWALSSQLTDAGRVGECVLGVTVNLLMSDIEVALYSVHTTVST